MAAFCSTNETPTSASKWPQRHKINWGTGSTNTRLHNNTVFNNGGEGIPIGSNNVDVDLKDNTFFMNSDSIVDYGSRRKRSDRIPAADARDIP